MLLGDACHARSLFVIFSADAFMLLGDAFMLTYVRSHLHVLQVFLWDGLAAWLATFLTPGLSAFCRDSIYLRAGGLPFVRARFHLFHWHIFFCTPLIFTFLSHSNHVCYLRCVLSCFPLLLLVIRCSLCLVIVLCISRMIAMVSTAVPILETVIAHYGLPPASYLCEVDGNGDVLAGVEVEIPGDGILSTPQRVFFWSPACLGCAESYERAALQAIRFLQGLYGFVVRDYNYECVVLYRNCGNAAIAVAASAVRYATNLERVLAWTHSSTTAPFRRVFSGPAQTPANLALLYSGLLTSLYSI